jgi:hypothetical protein
MKKYKALGIILLLSFVWILFFPINYIAGFWGCHQEPMASFISPCLIQAQLIFVSLSLLGTILSISYFFIKLKQKKN